MYVSDQRFENGGTLTRKQAA